jgi:ribosomal protein S12 methylthiotransferase accessory factor
MMLQRLNERTSSRPAAVELRDVPRSDPRETIRRGGRLISSKVGLIKYLGHGIHHTQDAWTFALGIMSSDLSRFSAIVNTSKGGGGGEDLATALAATIGEAVERYCMFFYDKSEMVFATYRDVADDAVHPDLLRLYSAEQVPHLREGRPLENFTEDSRVQWVWGYSLTHRKPRLVPASLVYLAYEYSPDEAAIGSNASTGLAAGLTVEEAILTGIYEIIERDAFASSWLHRRFRRTIEIDEGALSRTLTDRFSLGHPKIELEVYDITLDIPVPSTFLVMKRPAEFGPALCVGTACRLNPADAVRKCMHEAGQALPYFRFLLNQLKTWKPRPDFKDVTAFDLHCVLYLKRPELVSEALAFTAETRDRVALSAMPNRSTGRVLHDIETCIITLAEAGHEVIVVDITTDDIVDLGMRAVRVIIPGLVPLHGDHNRPYLGVKRLYDVPARLGWPGPGADGRWSFNPYPHPFP